jgi:hypothetical protein
MVLMHEIARAKSHDREVFFDCRDLTETIASAISMETIVNGTETEHFPFSECLVWKLRRFVPT